MNSLRAHNQWLWASHSGGLRPLPVIFQLLLYYFDDDAIGDMVPAVLLLWLASGRLFATSMTVGMLVLFVEYTRRIFRPLAEFSEQLGFIQRAFASADRVFSLLDTPSRGAYYGGVTAAPALGRIMADALAYLGVPPDGDPWKAREEMLEARAKGRQKPASKKRSEREKRPEPAAPAETEEAVVVGPGQVPDLAGKPLRQAVVTLAALGCRVRVDGTGVVVRQSPAPGSDVPSDASCAVTLGDPPRPAENETALVARGEPSGPSRTAGSLEPARIAAIRPSRAGVSPSCKRQVRQRTGFLFPSPAPAPGTLPS